MTTRKAIKGVLGNFLGTYMSRHSDYDGYWLFGFLVKESLPLKINLLAKNIDKSLSGPEKMAVVLARNKFQDQVKKAGLSLEYIHSAELEMEISPDSKILWESPRQWSNYELVFKARAVMDNDREYERQKSVIVRPHNPSSEWRSRRAGT